MFLLICVRADIDEVKFVQKNIMQRSSQLTITGVLLEMISNL